jgi:predicted metal-dependent hydrolase
MENQIQFGKHTINFELKYAARKTLGIKVNPDTSVLVTAPQDLSIDKINEVVRKKAMWILNQKSYFLEMNPIDNEIIIKTGYSVHYLGRRYKLAIEVNNKEEVAYKGNLFLITAKKKERAEMVFKEWLKHKAMQKILEFSKPLIKKFASVYQVPDKLAFQEMPTRWGSCTVENKLIFNPRLIHTPKRCIEYVIMHELCHLVHKHHNKDFFDLLTHMMPDWEKRKDKLDTFN